MQALFKKSQIVTRQTYKEIYYYIIQYFQESGDCCSHVTEYHEEKVRRKYGYFKKVSLLREIPLNVQSCH